MDRFSAHIEEPTVITECEWCSAEICEDESYLRYEDVDFCCRSCATDWLIGQGAIEVMP